MQYRLLALDLDGTLLRHDGRVDDRDIAAIADLQRAGVTVTICTGRLHTGALGAAHACSIEGAIGCVEGSHLVEVASNKTLAHHGMPAEVTSTLRDAFGAHDLATFLFDAGAIHHDESGAPFASYVRTWSPNMNVVEAALAADAWAHAPLAAVAIGDREAVTAAYTALRPHAGAIFSVNFAVSACPGKHALLVRAAGPTKGTALAELCATAGCTLAEAVAVGDWFNDVPMFEVAGRSFVMGQAPDVVRAKATDELSRPAGSGGGVEEAIRRAWG